MWEALIAGLLAAIDTAIPFFSAQETNEKSAERQRENEAWQEEMMNKQNAYNDPSAQMQRLSKAGVNPSTAFMGNSQVVGNTSAGVNSSPLLPVVDPATSMGNFMNALTGGFHSIEQALDIKSTRQARVVQILEQNENLRQNSNLLGAQATEQLIINKYADARENLAREGQRSNINLNYRQSALLKANERKFTFEVEKILPEELKLKVQQGKLNLLDMDKVIAEISDLKASAALKQTQQGESQARIENLQASTENIQASTENIQMDTALKGAQRDLTEEEVLYYCDIQKKYLQYYQSMIEKNSADTGYTEEQMYWYAVKLQGETLDSSLYNFNERRNLEEYIKKFSSERPGSSYPYSQKGKRSYF